LEHALSIISFEDTLGCVAIEAQGEDLFTAPNIPMEYYRIFGGQLLAQGVAIAAATCEGKAVKSMHVGFPRAGDLRKPVEFRVDRLQDGRSFASRQILGGQEGKLIFHATVSLHVIEEGPGHQLPAPDVGRPEDATPEDLGMIPWETRVVGGVDLGNRDVGPPNYQFWQRTPKLPDDPMVHQALFAHSTDLTLIGTALRPVVALSEADSTDKIQTAVTSHSVWFHRPFRLDEWVLIAQESPSLAGARGFGIGHAYSAAGDLVASFAQESMIRRIEPK
jgi:acyl-CoA thioesterase-2